MVISKENDTNARGQRVWGPYTLQSVSCSWPKGHGTESVISDEGISMKWQISQGDTEKQDRETEIEVAEPILTLWVPFIQLV